MEFSPVSNQGSNYICILLCLMSKNLIIHIGAQLWTTAALLARPSMGSGYKILLRILRKHYFLEYPFFSGVPCFVGGDFLWNILYWWRACLQNGIFHNTLCFTGRHVLLEDMFFMWIFIVSRHVLRFKMSHILLEGLPYWKPYIK